MQKGQALLVMESPELVKAAKLAEIQVRQLDLRTQRQAGNTEDRAQALAIREALNAKWAEWDGVAERQATLVLHTPISGVVADRAESLYPGRWINKDLPVAYVVAYPDATVTGEELLDHLSSRLTRSKLPVSVTVVDDLPRNPVGKIDKPTLRIRARSVAHST